MTPTRLAAAALLLVALVAGTGCGSAAMGDELAAADLGKGKELFVQECGQCHRLADAGTQGTIGPDLDLAFANIRREVLDDDRFASQNAFEESTIRDVVRGQIAYPVETPPTGEPGMPANLVTGADADAVAAYVASVAALPVEDTGAQGEGTAAGQTDGKEIFLSAGCGSCHTLADAGTSATIGPSLDESQPSVPLAIDRVTNGKGQMPAFGDRLSEEEIRAVSEYVAEASRR